MSSGTDILDRFLADHRLPPDYRTTIERHWAVLAGTIAARAAQASRCLVVGVTGSQGSGKSTMCAVLELLLAERHGLRSATLSLDDLYLTRAEREALAREVHPLLRTRGVPGTHDVALARDVLLRVRGDAPGGVALPRFDKAIDDRAAEATWPVVSGLDVLLFEGWCVGAEPQTAAELSRPVNSLEAVEDPDGTWRAYANAALAGEYRKLFALLDFRVLLLAPGFDTVWAWRRRQEEALRAARGPQAGMTDTELRRFIMHFERITQHVLRTMPQRADAVFVLDHEHQVVSSNLSGLSLRS
jgi:D-glycerate 3-kinase